MLFDCCFSTKLSSPTLLPFPVVGFFFFTSWPPHFMYTIIDLYHVYFRPFFLVSTLALLSLVISSFDSAPMSHLYILHSHWYPCHIQCPLPHPIFLHISMNGNFLDRQFHSLTSPSFFSHAPFYIVLLLICNSIVGFPPSYKLRFFWVEFELGLIGPDFDFFAVSLFVFMF